MEVKGREMTYPRVHKAFQAFLPSMKGIPEESEKELRVEYVRCDHMKSRRVEKTMKHGSAG